MTKTFVCAAVLGAVASLPASKLKAVSERRLQRAAESVWPPSVEEKELVGADPTDHLDNMPPAVIANRLAERLGYGPLERETTLRIQNAIHYGFGALFGGAYGALANAFPGATAGIGTAAGAALYFGSHGSALPLLRVQVAPWRLPRAAFAWELASHLLFGATLEVSRRAGVRLVNERCVAVARSPNAPTKGRSARRYTHGR